MAAPSRMQIMSEKAEDIYDIILFDINPENINVSEEQLTKMYRTISGFQHMGFPIGLVTMNFSGKVPLYNTTASAGQKFYGGAYKDSPTYQWFGFFREYIKKYQKWKFYIQYSGYLEQFQANQVLVGSLSIPEYNLDANNPRLIDYNFNFSGIPSENDQYIFEPYIFTEFESDFVSGNNELITTTDDVTKL